jgi:hypothetical protein
MSRCFSHVPVLSPTHRGREDAHPPGEQPVDDGGHDTRQARM